MVPCRWQLHNQPAVMSLVRTICDGCRLNRAGRCQDRAVYGKDSGDLLTDDGPRVRHENVWKKSFRHRRLFTDWWLAQMGEAIRRASGRASGRSSNCKREPLKQEQTVID